jgi:GNAT superfamily N-acetyltransferase
MKYSIAYNFVRARQLEGTYSGDEKLGAWGTTWLRVVFGWGRVPESAWPYYSDTRKFGDPEPPGMDALAKEHRIRGYQRIRSLREHLAIIQKNQLRIESARKWFVASPDLLTHRASFEITNQFVEAPGGMIVNPPEDEPVIGSHSVALVDADYTRRLLRFPNSWGARWGDHGWGMMPFEFFDRWMIEAWLSDERTQVLPRGDGAELIKRDLPDPLGDVLTQYELYDGASDERMAWAFAVRRDGNLDVEELFVRPGFRRRGYAGRLVDSLKELANGLGKPLRVWIPFVDCGEANREGLTKVIQRLGLSVCRSGVSWAGYVATPAKRRSVRFDPIRIPPAPAHVGDRVSPSEPRTVLRGTADGTAAAEEAQWAKMARRTMIRRLAEDD